jgi:putative phosphoesterase
MKIAIIADIHANLEALNAVLENIKRSGIKNIICAGDIVGYGANPNECCDVIRAGKIPTVLGNHDKNALDLKDINRFNNHAQAALRWTNKILTNDNRKFLSKLDKKIKVEVGERTIVVVHGSLNDPLFEYVLPSTSDALLDEMINKAKAHALVMGHTHIPFIKRFDNNMLIINPGAVGQPRDNISKASYAFYDTATFQAGIVRVEYDIESASKKIITAGLPNFLAERLYNGK